MRGERVAKCGTYEPSSIIELSLNEANKASTAPALTGLEAANRGRRIVGD